MSIIFGLEPRSNQTVAQDLLLKGIKKLKVTPSTLNMIGVPAYRQPAFQQYSQFLPAFMKSAATKTSIEVRLAGYPIESYMKVADCFPFDYPELVVSFLDKKVSADQSAMLVNLGGNIDVINERRVYTFKRPSPDIIKSLYTTPGVNHITSAANGQVNLRSLLALRRVVMIFSAFYRTHSYPAFKDPEHFVDLSGLEIQEINPKKRKAPVARSSGRTKRTAVADAPTAEEESGTPDEEDEEPTDDSVKRLYETIVKIRTPPTFLDKEQAFTTRATLGGVYGIFSPFFTETQHYDAKMVPRLIKHFFAGCLGVTKTEIGAGFAALCSEWGVVGNTEIGKMLTHMAACIELALMAQARPIPLIENGKYFGTIISGYGFTIQVGEESYTPVAPEYLLREIDASAVHKNVLERVLKEAGFDLEDGMGEGTKILNDTTLTSLKLRRILKGHQMTDSQRENVRKVCGALSFEQASWSAHYNNIVKMFDLLKVSEDEWDIDTPIHPSTILSNDTIEVVLSCFGVMSISFRPVEGRSIKVSAKTFDVVTRRQGDPASTVETKPFNHLYVRSVALRQAVADLKKVRETKEVQILTNLRRSDKHADRELSTTGFTAVIAELKIFCGVDNEGSTSSTLVPMETATAAIVPLDDW